MAATGDARRRFTFVTLGARDLRALRSFYGRWTGAPESRHSTEDWVAFELGETKLCLWPIDLLRNEGAPGRATPDRSTWNGITLAFNVSSRDEVDALIAEAVAAGGSVVAEPSDRDWGGYSGYIADPEGNHWEVAWSPDVAFD